MIHCYVRACVLGLLLASNSIAVAQEPAARPFGHDNHAFRFILFAHGLKPLTEWQQLIKDPSHTALVVFGATEGLEEHNTELSRFTDGGGSIFLATDRRTSAGVYRFLSVTISGERVAALDRQHSYRGLNHCPIVSGFRPDHPLFANVRRIATNVPSFIREPAQGYQRVAFFPADTRLLGRSSTLFAATQEERPPKSLVVADHSVFINSMMLQDDNDNFAFAINCVNWISENGRRHRVLFLDEGEVVSKFDVSLAEIPNLSPNQLANLPAPPVEVINNMITAMEDDNIHNRLILERFSLEQIIRGVVIALTILLVVGGASRLWLARYSTEPGR